MLQRLIRALTAALPKTPIGYIAFFIAIFLANVVLGLIPFTRRAIDTAFRGEGIAAVFRSFMIPGFPRRNGGSPGAA